ncbi:hypothetical protein ACFQL1_03920 [Halomicroarcula sp. GCM10025709]|uniref:hypothetical protein n=1 Tax=Haloarcula TaxID=2237 RepID=UPI0024C28EDF|nr:hypothetical protein [Halomicroarcula sp. YJ-61-S]
MTGTERGESFGAFFKRYARTWHHAVATAALTALGTLTVLHRLFALLALLAYVLPPVVLYARSRSDAGSDSAGDSHSEHHGSGEPAWTTRTVPTDEALTDVTVDGGRAYAVGAAGTVLCDDGDGWEEVVADGPEARSTALAGVAATGTGAVWVAGDAGTVARIDAETGRHVSYAEPDGDTTNVVALGAAGAADGETVLLADGSGRLRRGRYRDGELAWDEPTTPGSGSSVSGVALSTPSTGFVCDTNQAVFRTTDGGRTADRIGLDAPGTPTDLAAAGADGCLVSDDSGAVSRYDGRQWTPDRVADSAVAAVATRDGQCLASGPAGTVFERDGDGWTRVATPATVPLDAVALGEDRAVAVGADGTVVERVAVP